MSETVFGRRAWAGALAREGRSTLPDMGEGEHGPRRFGAAAQAAEWDARYREREGARWSGRPNGRLQAEVAGLTPGRALDVGCGAGADAIWLARSGWAVTAIDVSDVAVSRARKAAERFSRASTRRPGARTSPMSCCAPAAVRRRARPASRTSTVAGRLREGGLSACGVAG
jgi:SAM-dependent methyltransferase